MTLDTPCTDPVDYELLDATDIAAGYYSAAAGDPPPVADVFGRAFRAGYREGMVRSGRLEHDPSLDLLIYRYALGMPCSTRAWHAEHGITIESLPQIIFMIQ